MKEEKREESSIVYTKSILMYLHIAILIISLFFGAWIFVPLLILFGFSIAFYDAKLVGTAYFISFGVPLLAFFALLIACSNMRV